MISLSRTQVSSHRKELNHGRREELSEGKIQEPIEPSNLNFPEAMFQMILIIHFKLDDSTLKVADLFPQ